MIEFRTSDQVFEQKQNDLVGSNVLSDLLVTKHEKIKTARAEKSYLPELQLVDKPSEGNSGEDSDSLQSDTPEDFWAKTNHKYDPLIPPTDLKDLASYWEQLYKRKCDFPFVKPVWEEPRWSAREEPGFSAVSGKTEPFVKSVWEEPRWSAREEPGFSAVSGMTEPSLPRVTHLSIKESQRR